MYVLESIGFEKLKDSKTKNTEIEEKLKIGASRLVKHCRPTQAIKDFYSFENNFEKKYCKMKNKFLPSSNQCDTSLKVHTNKKLDIKVM